jgi:hypothetical protein
MKKKRFMGFLGLLSCATLLTGCDLPAPLQSAVEWSKEHIVSPIKDLLPGEKEEKKTPVTPEPQPEPQPEAEIKVEGLPESFDLGTEVDMDKYVSLVGLESYEIVPASEESLLVEEHVIMPILEGDVSFKLKSGDVEKECSFKATSSMRAGFEEYFTDVGRNYEVYLSDYDAEEGWQTFEGVVHNDKYVVSQASGEAIVRFDNTKHTFYCVLEYDESTYQYTGVDEESVERIDPLYFDIGYNPELDIDFEETVAAYDASSKSEFIALSGEYATWFAEQTMFLPNGEVTYYQLDPETGDYIIDEETGKYATVSYPIEEIQFEYSQVEFDEELYDSMTAYVFAKGDEGLFFYAAADFYKGEDYEGFPILDAYCVPENKPELTDYWTYFEDFTLGDLFPSPESVLGSAGFISLQYGWMDSQGNYVDNPCDPQTWFGYYFLNYASEWVYSESSIWSITEVYDEETQEFLDYSPLAGKMEVGDEEKAVYDVYATEEGFYLEADDKNASIWNDSTATFGALREQSSWGEGCFSAAYTPEETEQEGYYSFSFAGGSFHDILYSVFAADEQGYLGYVQYTFDYFASTGTNLEDYTMAAMSVDLVNSEVTLEFYMPYFSEAAAYDIQITFSANPEVLSLTSYYEAAAAQYIPAAQAE